MNRALRAVLLHLSLTSMLWAVCGVPPWRVCEEYYQSDAVFIGRVVAASQVTFPHFDPGIEYTLQLQKVFRGPAVAMLKVFSERNSGGYYLDAGRTYLLFATRQYGHYLIGNCGNSAPLSRSAAAIREIHRLQAATGGGTITGLVLTGSQPPPWMGDTPVPGLPVVVRSTTRHWSRRVVTNRIGRFRLSVPVGHYVARPVSKHWKTQLCGMCWMEDPSHITIHAGQCVDLQWRASPKPAR